MILGQLDILIQKKEVGCLSNLSGRAKTTKLLKEHTKGVNLCELGLCAQVLNHFSRVRFCDHMDCSPPGSCPWDSPGKNTGGGCHSLLQIFPTQGLNPYLLYLQYCRQLLYPLSYQGSPELGLGNDQSNRRKGR